MNLPASLRKEMHELCCVYLLERMTVEQAARLENLVINNSDACQFFVESMSLDAHLQWGAIPSAEGFRFIPDQSDPLSQKEVEAASRRIARLPRKSIWDNTKRRLLKNSSLFALTGGLLLFFVFLIASFLWSSSEGATLVDSHHVVWSKETLPIEKNGKIETGIQNELLEGSVDLLFSTGVKVMITAPATFQITGKNKMSLSRGMLLANVTTEEGKGFTVETPSGLVTDLGTIFGVEVDLSGTSSTQVFKGKVQLTSSSGVKTALSAGKTMQCKVGEKQWEESEKLSTEFYAALQENNNTLKKDIVFVHRIARGIPGVDRYEGTSYLMYSKTPVEERFAEDLKNPWDVYTQHFIAVHFDETTERWLFQENQTYHEFKPTSTDLIIARTEPVEKQKDGAWSRKIISFKEQSGSIHGIPFGYMTGDITFHPNMLAGKPNAGEFTLKGTYFIRHTK
ncbi:hypothetical protein MNBD_PLANCTO02-2718 [hydrothermal vent metagenome]|uniref:FecR protein domain-containing protein n=1 Tax=hydrothermal vent metagenome TaxID=652676 RepID=A0A3B1DT94_9ZZZZ